jgi:hypothetical protein
MTSNTRAVTEHSFRPADDTVPPPNRRSIALKLENTGDYFQKYKCRSTRLFES